MLALWRPGRDALVLPAVTLLGYGGAGLHLASIHTSNLFPRAKSLVTCWIVGLFQLSFFVPTLLRMLQKTSKATTSNRVTVDERTVQLELSKLHLPTEGSEADVFLSCWDFGGTAAYNQQFK